MLRNAVVDHDIARRIVPEELEADKVGAVANPVQGASAQWRRFEVGEHRERRVRCNSGLVACSATVILFRFGDD